MFKENKKTTATDTLIGQGTLIEGTLASEASIRIEGEYRGDIECKADIIIGECGVARSNISAKDVVVAGKVIGDVTAGGRLTITSSGSVQGSIQAYALLIQDGGIFSGTCRMEPEKERSTPNQALRSAEADAAAAIKEQAKEKSRQAG